MKSFKNLALVFAAALITFGASAQSDTTSRSKTKHHEMKEKTKVTERPNGSTKTVIKSKPTNKMVKADSTTTK